MNVLEMHAVIYGKAVPRDMKVNESVAEYLVRKLETIKAESVSTAPTDGTRILILTHTYGFDADKFGMARSGTKWTECHFIDGEWREWCGNSRTMNTNKIDPIAWIPRPEVNLESF